LNKSYLGSKKRADSQVVDSSDLGDLFLENDPIDQTSLELQAIEHRLKDQEFEDLLHQIKAKEVSQMNEPQDVPVVEKSKQHKPPRQRVRKVNDNNWNKGNHVQNKIRKLLKKQPQIPAPSKEEMLNMLYAGQYLELIPYFKNEIGSVNTNTGVKLRIMQKLDPVEFNKFKKRRKNYLKRYKERKKKTMKSVRHSEDEKSSEEYYDSLDDEFTSSEELMEDRQVILPPEEKSNNAQASEESDQTTPQGSRPSKEEMLQIFRSGGYMKLFPYFRKEIGSVQSTSGIRLKIMEHVDPEMYAKAIESRRRASQRFKNKMNP
jgi:hypothetical protein